MPPAPAHRAEATVRFRMQRAFQGEMGTCAESRRSRSEKIQPSMRELIEEEAFTAFLQPVVDLATCRLFGHRATGRGTLSGLPSDSGELFRLAEREGAAVRLAELVRERGIGAAGPSLGSRLFLPSHPGEYACLPRLIVGLGELRMRSSDLLLVLEVPRRAAVTPRQLQWLRNELSYLAVEIAYQDLAPGSDPLAALAEAPPDYLELDRAPLLGPEPATRARILLAGLVGICRRLGVRVVAADLPGFARSNGLLRLAAHADRIGRKTCARARPDAVRAVS